MTATKPAPSVYISGLCHAGRHDRCQGAYSGTACTCPHHTAPEPQPRGPRIGSLFSGYGGLEQGVQAVLGGTVAWHCEIDPGACKILAHRYPDVPNHGDITAVNWARVEPVDVLTGGFPCQDVSAAGKRLGLRPDTRTGLWTQMAYAIDQLRPRLVVAENVRGLLSADAHSDLEPCPWCVGDGDGRVLRALGAVLGDLADLGYDASWHGLGACDVGAPHGRFRIFVVAWPAGADAAELGRRPARRDDGVRAARLVAEPASDTDRLGHERNGRPRHGRSGPADSGRCTPAHAQGDGRHEGRPEPARLLGGPDAALGGDAAAHTDGDALRQQPVALTGRGGQTVAGHTGADAPADTDQCGRRADLDELRPGEPDTDRRTAADADGDGLGRLDELHRSTRPGRQSGGDRNDADGLAVAAGRVDWGPYGPAITRWERCLGRPAPSPTERGKNGQPRLSPAFVEWLMGLPAGWVTDVPGITRNEALKALGNGVVPQQAAAALSLLLADVVAA